MHSVQQDIVSQPAKPLHMCCYLHHLLPKMFYLPRESKACFTLGREEPVQGWARRVVFVFNVLVLLSYPVWCTYYFSRSCSSLPVLLELPWLEGGAGGLLGVEGTESKAYQGEKQMELRCNSKLFTSVQVWRKTQRFPYWPTALAIRKEQVRWRDSPLTPEPLTGPEGSVRQL